MALTRYDPVSISRFCSMKHDIRNANYNQANNDADHSDPPIQGQYDTEESHGE